MSKPVEAILDECLEQPDMEAALRACLARHPEEAGELEPMLRLAIQLRTLGQPAEPSPAALRAGRERVLQQAARLRARQEEQRATSRLSLLFDVRLLRRSAAAVALACALLVMVLSGGTIAASANSLPGDALYPVKRAAEEFRLFLTVGGQAKANLTQEFDQRRRDEARAVAETRPQAEVFFRGQVASIEGDCWYVDGLRICLSEETVVQGEVAVGALVAVTACSAGDGSLLASRVSVEVEAPAPVLTATPVKEEPLPTVTPTVAPSSTVPALPPPSRPTSTPTATASPTATPVPPTPTPERLVKVRFKGRIDSIIGGMWTIGGEVVNLDGATAVDQSAGAARVGSTVAVVAVRLEDGSLLALQIAVERTAPAQEQPFEFQDLVASFGASEWVVGSHRLIITPDTQIEGTPRQGLLAQVKALRRGDGSLVALHIVVKPPSEEVQFEGTIQNLAGAYWTVDDVKVEVDDQTVVVGAPAIGSVVEVQGLLLPDGSVLATKVVVQPPPSPTEQPTLRPTEAAAPTPTSASVHMDDASCADAFVLVSGLRVPSRQPLRL